MMKKVLLFAAVGLVILCVSAGATNISTTCVAGWNYVSLPQAPYNSDAAVPDGAGRPGVLSQPSGDLLPVNSIWRLDYTQSPPWLTYGDAAFGGMLLGDGFFLELASGATWQYDAAPNGLPEGNAKTDMWISLPKAGWTVIGTPFNDQVSWSSCLVTDGSQMLSVYDAAVTAGWIEGLAWYLEPGQPWNFLFPDTDPVNNMKPWYMYQVLSYQDNLALVVPAVP